MAGSKGAKGKREPVQVPPPFCEIIDKVCDEDRAFFEQHAEYSFYQRPYVPGELWPAILPAGTWIEVHQIRPGVRIRVPHFTGVASQKDIEDYARLHGAGKRVLICSEEGEPVGVALS